MSKKTLNSENLTALGAERLAELLIEVSTGSAEIKRRLRLEISHSLGSAELAREVRKRLDHAAKVQKLCGLAPAQGADPRPEHPSRNDP